MKRWDWMPERTQGIWRQSPRWLRPFAAAVPWITVGILLLTCHIVSGTLSLSPGTVFELPATELKDGVATELVVLMMPAGRETLVFFDDVRYVLGDYPSEAEFSKQLGERVNRVKDRTLLIMADRRVSNGELLHLSELARRSGVPRVLVASKMKENSAE